MTVQIRQAALAIVVAFALVTSGIVWWQVLHANAVSQAPGNPRPAELARTADRGRILDRNGAVLVQNVVAADGSRSRQYAEPSLAATIGYVSTRYGLSGIESSENAYLSGQQTGDPLASAVDDLLHRQPRGDHVVLTIDAKLQAAAAAALGDRPGAVVALDPHTGAVLAMVSAPSFDAGAIDTNGAALLDDPGKPLLDRATQGLYPPGSVYKIVTAAAALDAGVVKPTDSYRCSGAGVVIQGFVVGCENAPPGQTQWDFKTGFAFSINATFAQVAEQIGSDRFLDYSRRFGLDAPLPFDIDTAESRTSPSGNPLGAVQLASSGFGQGQLQVTPLQMALVGATVANGGVEPRPYLVQSVRAADGSTVTSHSPADGHRVMSPTTASTLTDFMRAAVQEFGQAAGMLNQDIAGKTGTAETPAGNGQPDSWFVGFTPSGNAGIVVAAVVENGGPGSQAAGPIAEAVFKAYAAK
jgi:peptidoglycan glycosyltransferase